MEWIEANPLPLVCQKYEEQQQRYFAADEAEKLRMEQEEDFDCDCGSCEHGGERWYLSRKDELTLQRKAAEKGIERLQRKIAEIDEELSSLK